LEGLLERGVGGPFGWVQRSRNVGAGNLRLRFVLGNIQWGLETTRVRDSEKGGEGGETQKVRGRT